MSFIEDIKNDVNAISKANPDRNHRELKQKINSIVQFHSISKQLSNEIIILYFSLPRAGWKLHQKTLSMSQQRICEKFKRIRDLKLI